MRHYVSVPFYLLTSAWFCSILSLKNIQSKINTLRHFQVNGNIAKYDCVVF